MRTFLPIALLSLLAIPSCSPEDAKEAGTETPAIPNQPRAAQPINQGGDDFITKSVHGPRQWIPYFPIRSCFHGPTSGQ